MKRENMNPKITELLDEDLLPTEDLKNVAALCGLDVAKSLIDNVAGITISVPSNPYRKVIEKYISKNFDGTRKTLIQMVKDCSVTEKYVYRIWKKAKDNK